MYAVGLRSYPRQNDHYIQKMVPCYCEQSGIGLCAAVIDGIVDKIPSSGTREVG